MDNQDLVTVCSVKNPTEAEVIRAALESIGIKCMIGGESQAGLAGVLAIDVMTSAADADRAQAFLDELRQQSQEEESQDAEESDADEPSEANTELPTRDAPPK